MNIIEFRHFISKTNINNSFYWFCCKKKTSLFFYSPYLFILFLLKTLHLLSERLYTTKYWTFLNKISLEDTDLEKFKNYFQKNIKQSNLLTKPDTIIIDNVPNFLLLLFSAKNNNILGLDIAIKTGKLEKNFLSIEERLKKLNLENSEIHCSSKFYVQNVKNKLVFKKNDIFDGRHHYTSWQQYIKKSNLYILRDILVLGLATGLTGILSIILAGYHYSRPMTMGIFHDYHLIFLNCVPIFLLLLILYFVTSKVWLSYLIGSLPWLILAIANHFKLMYRDDPVQFSDITLISEGIDMGKKYSTIPSTKMVILLFVFLIFCILLKIFLKNHYIWPPIRLGSLVISFLLLVIASQTLLLNDKLYESITEVQYGNPWNHTNQYMSRGFNYAFLHSLNANKLPKPEHYSKKEAQKTLEEYSYTNIPQKKKVNVVFLMLEAFNDFSKYDTVDIDPTVYAGLHQIQKESIHGKLVTNIFGGGTIDTERKAVTGYSQLEDFHKNTNSYVRYFNEQGYYTQSLHPSYGWFYNRRNVNEKLGFDDFKYTENYYSKQQKDFLVKDDVFFNNIHEFYKTKTADNQPYFNLSVTYQNHGPYPDTFDGKPLLNWKNGYNKKDFAIINNYLTGIKETNEALVKLLDSFRDEDPTIIVFFGDHNPWLGSNNSGYDMMNINLDLSDVQGFENYYETPYVIWANDSAKKNLKNDFEKKGPTISPMFLMNQVFEEANWKGNPYLQYTSHLKKEIDVIGVDRYKENGKFVKNLSPKNKNILDVYKNTEYYYMNNFNK